MEYHIFAVNDNYGLRVHPYIFDAEYEGQAISKAFQYVAKVKEGTTVGLFKRDEHGNQHKP